MNLINANPIDIFERFMLLNPLAKLRDRIKKYLPCATIKAKTKIGKEGQKVNQQPIPRKAIQKKPMKRNNL